MQAMTDRILQGATIASAVGALMVAGVFFAFSNFVMPALARLPGAQGVTAMNAINITVVNAWFITLLFGTAILGTVLTAMSFTRAPNSDGWLLLAATAIYAIGCIVVTMAFNVPLNEAIASNSGTSLIAIERWNLYISDWTRWNTIRATASCASGIIYIVSLMRFSV
jgi:uncharacterized membrane protein